MSIASWMMFPCFLPEMPIISYQFPRKHKRFIGSMDRDFPEKNPDLPSQWEFQDPKMEVR